MFLWVGAAAHKTGVEPDVLETTASAIPATSRTAIINSARTKVDTAACHQGRIEDRCDRAVPHLKTAQDHQSLDTKSS